MDSKSLILERGRGRVVIVDSISFVGDETGPGDVIVCASHGGFSAGEYVLKNPPPKAVILNDAGLGKDNAGIIALGMLGEKGIAAATVSHNSARIGDSRDTWENGVISHVNSVAASSNISVGMTVKEVCRILLEPETQF
jgi:hypothetical protein